MGMVLWGKLSWHPAAAAWREVAPTAPTPECIEVLHRENGTATYRLVDQTLEPSLDQIGRAHV